MGLGRWFRRVLEADDGYEPDLDEIVTVASVSFALAPMVVTALEEAGIRAEAVPQRHAYGATIKARILCFERDRAAAMRIVDGIFDPAGDGQPDEETPTD